MASHHQHNLKKFLTVSLESKKLIPAENAPLPQLDRGTDYESVRRGFESLTAHHLNVKPPSLSVAFCIFAKVTIAGYRQKNVSETLEQASILRATYMKF